MRYQQIAVYILASGRNGTLYGALVIFGQEKSSEVQLRTTQLAHGLSNALGVYFDARRSGTATEAAE